MGGKNSIPLGTDELNILHTETGLSKSHINSLHHRFLTLASTHHDKLCQHDLMSLSELRSNPLGSRIVEALFSDCNNVEKTMDFHQFVKTVAIFKPHKKADEECAINSREKKLKFVFNVYDIDSNEAISEDEMLVLLKMMVGSKINEEELMQIARRAVADADEDGDGLISFDDFKHVLERLEAENLVSMRILS